MTVVLELARKPSDRARFTEDGEIALAGIMEVDRGIGFEAYTEPEIERMANRLDGEDEIVVDGAVWSGFPELAFYLEEKPRDRWGEAVIDVRLRMFQLGAGGQGGRARVRATGGGLVNGEHAHRLERIEKRVDELHDKLDELAEAEAANSADIVWQWAVRGLVASAVGIGGFSLRVLV